MSVQPPPGQEFPRAGLWRRLGALLYDAFLVVSIWMLLGYAALFLFGPEAVPVAADGRVRTDPRMDALLFALMAGSAFGFHCLSWLRGGQTLGMAAWRIRVESREGGPPGAGQALVRFAAAWPAFLLLGLGYLWLYLDPRGDAVHDRLSGTRVVLLPKSRRTRAG